MTETCLQVAFFSVDESGEQRRVKHGRKTNPTGCYWADYCYGKLGFFPLGQSRRHCECALKLSACRFYSWILTHNREGCLLHRGWAGLASVQSLVIEQSRTQSKMTWASEVRCSQAPPGCGNVQERDSSPSQRTIKNSSFKTIIQKIAVLFTIAKTWRQPKCLSTEKWIKKMQITQPEKRMKQCHLEQHGHN